MEHHFSWYSFLGIPHELIHVAGMSLGSVVFLLVILKLRTYFLGEKKIVPPKTFGIVSLVDMLFSMVFKLAIDTFGSQNEAKKYFPLFACLFLFIFINNALGLLPGMVPATDNLNTTLAIGVFVFIYYNYMGVKTQGIVAYLKHFCGPMLMLAPLMLVIELISHTVRPIALGLRLRGNMYGDHLVLGIFSELVPFLVPVIFLGLGLFVCFIQAFVFTLLSIVYVAMATHSDHDHEKEHAH